MLYFFAGLVFFCLVFGTGLILTHILAPVKPKKCCCPTKKYNGVI